MREPGNFFIGTSGWVYPHWKGVFYPEELPQKEWLRYYSQSFDTVEVNATFYHQMKAKTFDNWQKTVGPKFTFAIKGSRFITHIKRLKDCRGEVERFFEATACFRNRAMAGCRLGESSNASVPAPRTRNGAGLGIRSPGGDSSEDVASRQPVPRPGNVSHVILWQLPPGMAFDELRLKSFLALIHPRGVFRGFRQAFEFRHESWFSSNIYKILKAENCALVIADSPSFPKAQVLTSDFVYLRFHGGTSLYASNYSEKELEIWAKKIKKWQEKGLDVYGYFNNDAMGYAVKNAKTLLKLISGWTPSC